MSGNCILSRTLVNEIYISDFVNISTYQQKSTMKVAIQ